MKKPGARRGRNAGLAPRSARALSLGPMRSLLLCALVGGVAAPLGAQCPDGSPPPCRAAARPGPGTARGAPEGATAPAASVAVLTFADAGADSSAAWLASGLSDAVTARLSRVDRLTVASRTAVRRLRGAETMATADLGRSLGVAWLLSGTLRPTRDRIVASVELVQAGTGRQVWARQYDRPRSDLLGLQALVAQDAAGRILGGLRTDERGLLDARPTRDPRAFELYLGTAASMFVADPRNIQRAIAALEQALRIDPDYSDALGRLAYFYGFAANWNLTMPGLVPESLVTRGLAYADRALAADSSSVDAWSGRGYLLFFSDPPQYEASLASLRRGVALDTASMEVRNNYAAILRRLGDFASAEEQYRLLIQADPGQYQAVADLGFVAYTLRRYDEARRWYDSAIAIRPDAWQNQGFGARARLAVGDTAGARRAAARMLELVPLASRPQAIAVGAQIAARTGDTAAARAAAEPVAASLGTEGPLAVREGFETALALVALGERGRALDLLERIRPRGAWLWSYLVMPLFDPLRADPRFQRLVRESAPPGAPRL